MVPNVLLAQQPHPPCSNWARHSHTAVYKPLPPSSSHSFSCSFSLAPSGSEPDIPAGPVPLKWIVGAAPVTGAGTGESRSVWLRRTALAQGLISRPSTLPTLSTQARIHTFGQMQTLPTLSPQRSCNKTNQIWRLRQTATAQLLWSWLAATRIWTLEKKKAELAVVQNYTGSCGVRGGGVSVWLCASGKEPEGWLICFLNLCWMVSSVVSTPRPNLNSRRSWGARRIQYIVYATTNPENRRIEYTLTPNESISWVHLAKPTLHVHI